MSRKAPPYIKTAREALLVARQTIMEVALAQSVGANWYTKGAPGLYGHIAMHVKRGQDAIEKVLELIGE